MRGGRKERTRCSKPSKPTPKTADIVAALRGKWHGSYALCICPAHEDRTPSLSVRQGDRGLLVHCFAGCVPSRILEEINRLDPKTAKSVPDYRPPGSAMDISWLWEQGTAINGTLAERYLVGRNLPTDATDLRFHPNCQNGRKPLERYEPTLMVGIRLRGKLVGIQRIFLDPNTAKHRDKKIIGRSRSASWEGIQPTDTLAIAESFEDAHAYATMKGIPCWSSMAANKLHAIAIPDSVQNIILAPDNDRPGRIAVNRGLKTYRDAGYAVEVDLPNTHEDWAGMIEARAGNR